MNINTHNLWDGYSPIERRRFLFHTTIAVCCLPLYYLFPIRFGLLMMPYLLFMGLVPKNEYLLPVILHMLYGSQQRYAFILGCFIYVLIHCFELRRYSLHWLYVFYMALLPYFLWYFWQKLHMPRFVDGVGQYIGGLFSHLLFSVAFWGAIVVKKTGRPVFRGLVLMSLILVLLMALIGGGASIDRGDGEGATHTVYSFVCFFAISFLAASCAALFSKRTHGYVFEKFCALIGCVVLALGFFHITKFPLSFTGLGLALLSIAMVWLVAKCRKKTVLILTPLPLFIISNVIVLSSNRFVDKYRGLYKNEGEYREMSMTSVDSVLKKLQRKAVDDRASIWAGTIRYIRDDVMRSPIWLKPVPYMEVEMETGAGNKYIAKMVMASHNVMLNLVRNYGFYGGVGLYLVFVWFACRKKNREYLVFPLECPTLSIMAACLAQSIIGGHTGHYPTGSIVGPVIFCCYGACWGELRYYYEKKRNYGNQEWLG